MSRWKKCFLGIAVLILAVVSGWTAAASAPLDEIEQEIIRIQTQDDGSLYIHYHLEWRVLDSSTEGPLSWVKIGIPNEYVEEMSFPEGSCIKKIQYYGSGGDYVRLDLDREYMAGEVVSLDFAIHQHQMYEEKNGSYVYRFTPGWFDEIEVKKLQILWEMDEYTSSDMASEEDIQCYTAEYYDLEPGQTVQVTVSYPDSEYQFQDDYREAAGSAGYKVLIVILVIAGVIGIPCYGIWLYIRRKIKPPGDDYTKRRGLGGSCAVRGRTTAGGGSCACACACACAGGGRAGCSRKDFYVKKLARLSEAEK